MSATNFEIHFNDARPVAWPFDETPEVGMTFTADARWWHTAVWIISGRRVGPTVTARVTAVHGTQVYCEARP